MRFLLDQDLHCHTFLSECCKDEHMTAEAMMRHAEACGYREICVTDHMWDPAVPGASDWYAPQNIEHVRKSLPLPQGTVKMGFGCETEYCGNGKLGLARANMDAFDFIVIPPNHFHMEGFVRPASCDTDEKVAELFVTRLEELTKLDLPFEKVGIAHITCTLMRRDGNVFDVLDIIDEDRFRAVARAFARLGAGIELNTCGPLHAPKERWESEMRLFRLCKAEGCRFYLGTDSHDVAWMDSIARMGETIDSLGLTEDDHFRLFR